MKFDSGLVEKNPFPLLSDMGLEELAGELALNQKALPHVGHLNHQAELPILLGDDGTVAELDGLRPLFGSGNLGQKGARDEDLNQGCDDQLSNQQENSMRAFLRDGTDSIANGCLGFQGEKKRSSERVYFHDAGSMI